MFDESVEYRFEWRLSQQRLDECIVEFVSCLVFLVSCAEIFHRCCVAATFTAAVAGVVGTSESSRNYVLVAPFTHETPEGFHEVLNHVLLRLKTRRLNMCSRGSLVLWEARRRGSRTASTVSSRLILALSR